MTDTGADDLCLLQAFEPVIRFTAGELFLPTAIEPYVAHCAMWEVEQDGTARRLVAEGELTIERLVDEAAARQGADLSLRFVTEPLGRRAYRQWRKRPGRPEFHSGGRFGQVGLLSRLLDAVFRLGLLLRGTVPGGLAAAAEQTYRNELDSRHHPYYGRVVRDGGYVVLQYWFFYAMNDWRSGFGGANDHEADWEQVTVYLVEGADGECRPAWVAFSAHDEVGDDLRRRWDDPELVRVGDHPVVFAGAGSHSGAFVAGEYVTVVNPPHSLRGVFRVLRAIASVVTPWSRGEIARGVGVPFVDYARGDGETLGHGQASPWTPVLIDDNTRWVEGYRGLWGLDTRDRFGGERAPAGPRYERGGAIRQSWFDPLGWGGLHKVPATPAESRRLVLDRVAEIDAALAAPDAELVRLRGELRELVAAADWLRDRRSPTPMDVARQSEIDGRERTLNDLTAARAGLSAERVALADALDRPPQPAPPQGHLRHKVVPTSQVRDERERFLRVWSTISSPLLFAAAAWVLIEPRPSIIAATAAVAVLFLTIEAIARKRLLSFLVALVVVVVAATVALAVVQGVVVRWQIVLGVMFAVIAVSVLVANLRDLRRG